MLMILLALLVLLFAVLLGVAVHPLFWLLVIAAITLALLARR